MYVLRGLFHAEQTFAFFFFFFSPWVWRGTLLASQGIVRPSLFVLCVGGVMERAGERRTQRNVACSLNRWGLFTPSKSTLTIARNVRYVCLCENSHNAIFAKCFNVLIFNHGFVGMLSGCGRCSGCRGFFFPQEAQNVLRIKYPVPNKDFMANFKICIIALFNHFSCIHKNIKMNQTVGVAVSHQRWPVFQLPFLEK